MPSQYFCPYLSRHGSSKNDPVMIRKAVLSCLASSYSQIEIILVNDGSTDHTGEVMDLLRKENPRQVKVVQLSCNVGKRRATREGIVNGRARGDIIILVDSDCELDNKAIEKLVSVFDNPEVGAVSGLGRSYNPNETWLTKMQDTWYDGQFSIMKGMESAFGTVTCCPGILSAYRKEAIMPCLDAWASSSIPNIKNMVFTPPTLHFKVGNLGWCEQIWEKDQSKCGIFIFSHVTLATM